MTQFHSLTIKDKNQETPHAVSIAFEIPDSLLESYRFKAGQYLTIKYIDGDTELRRSYSLCSAADSGEWRVGIKKTENGRFSKIANDTLRVGDRLDVMLPQGHFTLETNPNNKNQYLALAAGSGITPILGMIKTVLSQEPHSKFSLVYGNQNKEEAMFYNELEALKSAHPDQLSVTYFFSRQRVDQCHFGRIERSMVKFLLKNEFKGVNFHATYLCGPEAMIDEAKETLIDSGMDSSKIHFELFTSSETGSLTEAHDGQTMLTVTLDDETESFAMPQGKSVLEAALEHGLDAPYSCQGGICSTCIARLKSGKVEMRKNQILTDSELEEGFILTCQSHPSTPSIEVDYDDV